MPSRKQRHKFARKCRSSKGEYRSVPTSDDPKLSQVVSQSCCRTEPLSARETPHNQVSRSIQTCICIWRKSRHVRFCNSLVNTIGNKNAPTGVLTLCRSGWASFLKVLCISFNSYQFFPVHSLARPTMTQFHFSLFWLPWWMPQMYFYIFIFNNPCMDYLPTLTFKTSQM